MRIHLVGGFLGSGKTTAIANAVTQLSQVGLKIGVITNDQGKYLVDSRFMSLSDVAGAEVTGGCFCCNYNLLDQQISTLKERVKPTAIFAESVGSCTDLIATVVKPLTQYRASDVDTVTFSGFVDSRMLLMHLQGKVLPFNDETNYIWKKQIEESEILVINKVDLLTPQEALMLQGLARDAFAGKKLLFQNSLDAVSIGAWIDLLATHQPDPVRRVIDVDYQKYGAGEANLAWLDQELEITSVTASAVNDALNLIEDVTSSIGNLKLPVGHLKFLLSTPRESVKISFTTVEGNGWREAVTLQESNNVQLMVNARVQASPHQLRSIVAGAVNRLKEENTRDLRESNISFFQPGYPNPTHRFTS